MTVKPTGLAEIDGKGGQRPPEHRMRDVLRTTAAYLARPIHILQGYHLNDLRPDLVAGLTVAVILMPQAIAYAMIAELPPQTGLFTAIFSAIVGALWGSSNQLQTGPTNAASLLILSTLLPIAGPGPPSLSLLQA